jgi:hypothetical protein
MDKSLDERRELLVKEMRPVMNHVRVLCVLAARACSGQGCAGLFVCTSDRAFRPARSRRPDGAAGSYERGH